MASEHHDFIIEIIKLKMKQKGCTIVASEGKYKNRELIKIKIPPQILRHRPDVIGYNRSKNAVFIGEAKYFGDLASKRSKQQIEDFGNLAVKKENIYFVLGFPLSEEDKVRVILKKKDLDQCKKIILLKVPDRWLVSNNE